MIYLDHNATTPLDPRVLEAMLPWLRGKWGNASSRDHAYGWDAAEAVEDARAQVAESIGAKHNEIVFTSGATEASHLALFGLFPPGPAADDPGLLLTAVEHEALRSAARRLERNGVRVDTLDVRPGGGLDLEAFAARLASRPTRLACVMAANNETGVVFPMRASADLAHAHGALLLADASQALGKIPVDAERDGFDVAMLSAHKLYGPKGAGALYLRGGAGALGLDPLADGGGQEGGIRPGTLNVPAIVGFGEACRIARSEAAAEAERVGRLRDRLEALLLESIPGGAVNAAGETRLPNTSSFIFPGVDARVLLRQVPGVAASTRSACSSGDSGPSHVLTAMGLESALAFATVRFSLGRATTAEEIDRAAGLCAEAWRRLAGMGT
jgi:cysteine desulfurase